MLCSDESEDFLKGTEIALLRLCQFPDFTKCGVVSLLLEAHTESFQEVVAGVLIQQVIECRVQDCLKFCFGVKIVA